MKIAYIGTPQLSAGLLQKILNNKDQLGIEIPIVITQPDQPVGRKQIMTPSSVKTLAQQNNLLISHDMTLLKEHNVDLALLFAFGKIITQETLDTPTYGFWNIHPSMLPSYRGATPTVFPILLGDTESGVSLMQMDSELDHGPVIEQAGFKIHNPDTRLDIEKKVIDISYSLFEKAIRDLTQTKSVSVVQQNHNEATYTRPLTKMDGYVDKNILLAALKGELLEKDDLPHIIKEFYATNKLAYPDSDVQASHIIWNMHRALLGWPGVWTTITIDDKDKRLKILDVALKNNIFELITVQLEGKNPVPYSTFSQSYSIR